MTSEPRASRSWVAFLALMLLGVCVPPACSQQTPHAVVDAEALWAAARPVLEENSGWRLDTLARCRVATDAELHQVGDDEVAQQVGAQFAELEGLRRKQAVDVAAAALQSVRLACVDPAQGLLLFPENARRMSHWHDSLTRLDSPPVLQLALVHEAARAELERRYGLAKRRLTCLDTEAYLALQAVVEGRALWLTRQTARRLGTESSLPLLGERYLHAPDGGVDPVLRLVVQEVLKQRQWAGARGLAFHDFLVARGVTDVERLVLTQPPRLRDWVVRPELFLRARQTAQPELAEVLQRLEDALPRSTWSAAQEPWTPAMLRQMAALFEERDRVERLAGQWVEGRSLVWTGRKDPMQQVAIGVIRFKDETSARACLGLTADLQRKQDELMGRSSGGTCRILESRARSLQLQGTSEAACTEKKMQFANAAPRTVTQVWARHGDTVLQISWTGVPADTGWAERLVQTLVP